MKCRQLKDLQRFHSNLKSENGSWRDMPIGYIQKARTPEKNLNILRNILGIIMASDNISADTKIFIGVSEISMKKANERLNQYLENESIKSGKHISRVSYTTTINRLNADNDKIEQILGVDTLTDIVYDNIKSTTEIDKIVDNLIREFGSCDKQRNNLLIDINRGILRHNKYIGNEEFFDKLNSIRLYLKSERDKVQEEINKDTDFVGYFNYLLSTKGLYDEQLTIDRDRLIRFLNGEDCSTNKNIGGTLTDNITIQDGIIIDL